MNYAVIDPQAIGWKDDGSESGFLRTKLIGGNYAFVPFCKGLYGTAGTGTINHTYDANFMPHGNYIFTSMNSPSLYFEISFNFTGKCLGLAAATTFAGRLDNVTVSIDGVPYRIPNAPGSTMDNSVLLATGTLFIPVAEDLPEGIHQCTIHAVGPASGSMVINFYGFYVDARSAYPILPQCHVLAASALVAGTSRTAFSTLFSGVFSASPFISAIHLANVTGSDCLATLDRNSVNFWRHNISANQSKEIIFPTPIAIAPSLFAITAQTGNAIQASLFGVQQ